MGPSAGVFGWVGWVLLTLGLALAIVNAYRRPASAAHWRRRKAVIGRIGMAVGTALMLVGSALESDRGAVARWGVVLLLMLVLTLVVRRSASRAQKGTP
jgi:hypothetical protein